MEHIEVETRNGTGKMFNLNADNCSALFMHFLTSFWLFGDPSVVCRHVSNGSVLEFLLIHDYLHWKENM